MFHSLLLLLIAAGVQGSIKGYDDKSSGHPEKKIALPTQSEIDAFFSNVHEEAPTNEDGVVEGADLLGPAPPVELATVFWGPDGRRRVKRSTPVRRDAAGEKALDIAAAEKVFAEEGLGLSKGPAPPKSNSISNTPFDDSFTMTSELGGVEKSSKLVDGDTSGSRPSPVAPSAPPSDDTGSSPFSDLEDIHPPSLGPVAGGSYNGGPHLNLKLVKLPQPVTTKGIVPFDDHIDPDFPAEAPRARALHNVPEGHNLDKTIDVEFKTGYRNSPVKSGQAGQQRNYEIGMNSRGYGQQQPQPQQNQAYYSPQQQSYAPQQTGYSQTSYGYSNPSYGSSYNYANYGSYYRPSQPYSDYAGGYSGYASTVQNAMLGNYGGYQPQTAYTGGQTYPGYGSGSFTTGNTAYSSVSSPSSSSLPVEYSPYGDSWKFGTGTMRYLG